MREAAHTLGGRCQHPSPVPFVTCDPQTARRRRWPRRCVSVGGAHVLNASSSLTTALAHSGWCSPLQALGNMRTVRAYAMEVGEVELYREALGRAGAAHRWLGVQIGVFQGTHGRLPRPWSDWRWGSCGGAGEAWLRSRPDDAGLLGHVPERALPRRLTGGQRHPHARPADVLPDVDPDDAKVTGYALPAERSLSAPSPPHRARSGTCLAPPPQQRSWSCRPASTKPWPPARACTSTSAGSPSWPSAAATSRQR